MTPISAHRPRLASLALRSGQREQLIEQVPGSSNSAAQSGKPHPGFLRHFGRLQKFCLQREGGQGRAKLMRRVRQEAPLRGDGLGDPRQEALYGDDEGSDLGRNPAGGNFLPNRL